MRRSRLVLLAAAGLAAAAIAPAVGVPGLPGLTSPTPSDPLPGATRLPNGWALDPAGTQVLTSRAPTGVTVAEDGSAVYAVTSGIFEEAVERVDPATLVAAKTLVGQAYQGVAADAAGNVWVSGGPANAIFHYTAAGPVLVDQSAAGPVPSTPNRGTPVTGYPGTMVLAGHQLFVAGNLSVPSAAARAAGAQACASSAICSVVNVVDVVNPSSPTVRAVAVGRDAYGLAYRDRGGNQTLYVSNWADQTNPARAGGAGTVSVVRRSGSGDLVEAQVVPVGQGPTGIALSPDGTTLAVANSDSDTVSLLPLNPDGSVNVTSIRTTPVGVPGAPLGTTPLAVAYDRTGTHLYVALAGLDALEVLDGRGSPIRETVNITYRDTTQTVTVPTFIPTGWYPDAMAIAPGSGGGTTRLYVANLRGNGAGPGYYGQLQPLVGTSTEGTLSAIDVPADPTGQAKSFASWTREVIEADQLGPTFSEKLASLDPARNPCTGAPAGGDLLCPAPGQPRPDPSQIHVVQILAENKTFDSYFGDTLPTFPGADADPSFTEYGAAVTTNQHQLAQAFSLSDNFWNEGAESSVLGHSWYSGGYTTVDNELTWGQTYDEGLRGQRNNGQYTGTVVSGAQSDPAINAQETTMLNPRRLLADEVHTAGLSERIYATDLNPGSAAEPDQIPLGLWGEGPQSPVHNDLAFPDTDRADMFLHGQTVSHAWDALETPTPPATFGTTLSLSPAGKAKFSLDAWQAAYQGCIGAGHPDGACQSSMPNYVYMTLPENHTYDVDNVLNPLDPTPQSMVADNDYAIGLIIQGLSRTAFWKNTIVFLSEDDNQFTGDHVDIHRTFLLTMGGLASRLGPAGRVSDEVGSFPSVLKTAELLLDLPPLTLFDWQSAPLHQMVAAKVPAGALPPYQATVPPTPSLAGGDQPAARAR